MSIAFVIGFYIRLSQLRMGILGSVANKTITKRLKYREILFGLFACVWVGNSTVSVIYLEVSLLHMFTLKSELFFCSCRTGAGAGLLRLSTAFRSSLVGLAFCPFIGLPLAAVKGLACRIWPPVGSFDPPGVPPFAVRPSQGVKILLYLILGTVLSPLQRICPWRWFHLSASFT